MYPTEELAQLNRQKQFVLRRSDRLRVECVAAARSLARPIGWLESGVRVVGRLAPFVALSSVFIARKRIQNRTGWMGLAWRFAPAAFRVWRALKGSPSRNRPALSRWS